jgi:hypothetical protein
MGLLIPIFAVTVPLAFLAGIVVHRVCKWLGRPDIGTKFGAITAIVWFVMWLAPVAYAVQWMFTTERVGLNGPESDRILERWKVPPGTASDLCYFRSARMSESGPVWNFVSASSLVISGLGACGPRT